MGSRRALRGLVVVVGLLVVLAANPGVVAGGFSELVQGEPGLEFSMATSHLEPGERTTVSVAVTNSGEIIDGGIPQFESQVQTAQGVTLEVEDRADRPFEVKSGPVALGPIQDGQTRVATFTLELDENASPGTYDLPLTASYDHTRIVGYDPIQQEPGYTDVEYVTRADTTDGDVPLVVEPQASFAIDDAATTTVTAGDTGTLTFDVENVGSETATQTRVQLRAEHSAIQFGQLDNPQPATSVYAATLDPGNATTVSARVIAAPDVSPGSYPVSVTVEYEDENGLPGQARPNRIGVDVQGDQTFSARDVRSNLSVGDDGTVRARLRNEGPEDVRNAVLLYQSQSQTLFPTETEYAVGNLTAGEATAFTFEFDVSEEASAGSRMPSFVVQYRNSEGDLRTGDPIDVPVTVGPEDDPFRIDPVRTTVEAGSGTTMELRVTNTGTERLEDVEAKLFADDPLASDNDEAFLGGLDPGESTEVAFDLSAGAGIIAKDYPVSLDFTYEDAEGDTELSDTYRVPVQVDEPAEGRSLWPFVLGGALVVIAVAIWRRDALRDLR